MEEEQVDAIAWAYSALRKSYGERLDMENAESLNGKEGHSFAPSRHNNKLNCIVVPCNCRGGATRNLALHVTLQTSSVTSNSMPYSVV